MPTSARPDPQRWRICVAPMLDWSDRHCRYFHRLMSKRALLYTEMVTTGALIHGDVERHLQFNPEEQPLALQLGGSEPADLATCARVGAAWGYSEINLNCGCPSERVQRGAFGACLMNEPQLVADCVRAMVDAVDIPVTVKHRIGIDQSESYDFVRDFVGTVNQAGCQTFIVHARNAWLKGLSPKDNREIPPLRYDWAYRLKRDFPDLVIVLNGGITTTEQAQAHLQQLDGVMLGRGVYHNPWWLSQWDHAFFGDSEGTSNGETRPPPDRQDIEEAMVHYMTRQLAEHATAWPSIARHMLGLRHGLPGARHWRRVWSDHILKSLPPQQVMALARGAQVS
ncbi:MAG: tRNA dihydrouridine(20/20a) synthase DusA [Rhodoferax sp.]|uniref:tRNA dihydrouridine(20/20a) synthase DusA n=1 Tax=Rhodoferax sp. TaxID=50421 RepID=UPI001B466CD5|nr:tRNA dihydrouridine(20/20a) synthase DusA [Rhodoferax sp.]MBP8286748.1 tRNA dihydrouridine(20/20a) synthase DusA [Rhodoferax sp.]MBP9149713.1 tRNA dihydrouridine(20/20a) synthase DusA [Rhodoferax sp.]MBP9734236.1 tRNA dihydrouridine(20/20a) synthase DusA [Rhodoferax sp.]